MSLCLPDSRRKKSVLHSYEKMLSQRVLGICLDWEDCNDFNELRGDPLYELCLDGSPASQPTLSKFENSIGHRHMGLSGSSRTSIAASP